MINFLREKVSGSKIRYNKQGFNLDLSYITPRIIAMSLPGEGIHKVYRNSINSVSKFLKENHDGKFKIFNLSGIRYDYEKFSNNVLEYSWDDHFPPSIDLLFRACQDIHYWLCKDVENVIAVNCLAGKGRTGTLICCYMIFCGRFESPEQVLEYYKMKRFHIGGGVTQPSQIRYIKYFASILFSQIRSPLIVQLDKINIKTASHALGLTTKPIFSLKSNNKIIYTNKKSSRDRQTTLHDLWFQETLYEIDTIQGELFLQGDIQGFLNHWGLLKLKKHCRFTFNTAFIDNSMELHFSKSQLDPDIFKNSKNFHESFEIILNFKQFCQCKSSMYPKDRCNKCKMLFNQSELEKWVIIKETIDDRIKQDPKIILFKYLENDDVDETLNKLYEEYEVISDENAE
ncbi:hypothetical protein SteCoe_37194 [Stentor coeruleus]|uniref:Phosphatidylinositol-3,4,5-trisphosphate 3-phosphatase n=1 Tax=Stentor coeruleus TaxID=5963 RepID=A0A1R2ANS0_9CILI|nr:hypothetical protein SteCoe_37194 [Stentor coeruleus]